MDKNLYDQFLIMQATIDSNRQDSYEKMNKQDSKIDKLTEMVENIMDQIQTSNYSPDNMDEPKDQYPTTMILANKKYPPLEVGNYTKIGGSSINNSKNTLLWTSITSKTTSICVSMR